MVMFSGQIPTSSNHTQETAHSLCEAFAELYELPVDYVWEEFVNPEVDDLATVTKALEVGGLMAYS